MSWDQKKFVSATPAVKIHTDFHIFRNVVNRKCRAYRRIRLNQILRDASGI